MFLIDGLWCVNPLFREFDIPVQMYGRLKIFDSHAVRIGFFEHRIHENPVSSAFSVFKKYAFLSERRHGYGGRSTGGSPCESPIAEYHIYNNINLNSTNSKYPINASSMLGFGTKISDDDQKI